MFRQIGAPEIILILLVLILLFGAKKLPDLSRSVGRSLRIFKSEVKDLRNDDDPDKDSAAPPRPRQVEGRVVDGPTLNGEPTRVPEAERDR
jgi:sec-independent protein translocase protein TatA